MMAPVDEGRELARLRERAGLKGREVGAALDVDKSAVSQWETGKARPSLDKIGPLDALYGGTGEVLAIYGISLPAGELAELRGRIAELETLVGLLLKAAGIQVGSDAGLRARSVNG